MKRLASLLLALGLWAAPAIALADFHGPGDVNSLLYEAEASSEKDTAPASKEKVVRPKSPLSGEDLWTSREKDIG